MKKKPTNKSNGQKIGGRKIKNKTFEAPEEGPTDHLNPVFSFIHTCPNRFQLSDWNNNEIKQLVSTLRDFSTITWREAKTHKGLGLRTVDPATLRHELPPFVSADETIYEFRASDKLRVFGYRVREVFRIIWFDRNHEVCKMS